MAVLAIPMRAWIALALSIPLLAGCLHASVTHPAPEAPPVTVLSAGAPLPERIGTSVELALPIHVVAVGFDKFDDGALLANVQPLLPQFQWVRAGTTGNQTPEPLQSRVDTFLHHP